MTPAVARRRERAALVRLRDKVERAVERLVAILDDLDGDPDVEDEQGDDEPEEDDRNLGWTSSMRQEGRHWLGSRDTGYRWASDDVERDDADHEPTLGAPERQSGSQVHWAAGGKDDREDDGDDLEANGDDEEPGDVRPATPDGYELVDVNGYPLY